MAIEKRLITNRAEWLEWRTHDLTASDVAAVAGASPYKSALAVYGEKAGLILPQEVGH